MIDTVALREKVLDLAIRGKLVPQDPNDEPASVLLERIRTQKQQMVKDGKLKAKDIKDDSIIFVGEDNLHYEKFADGTVKCIEDEIPFELPEGWGWCRLQTICEKEIKRGKAPKYVEKSGTLVFAQKCNTKKGKINITLAQYLDESTLHKYSPDLFTRYNDIIINSTGTGTLGRIGIFEESDDLIKLPIVPDSHITTVRAFSINVAKYVYLFLKANQPYFENSGEGSTNQKELRPEVIKTFLIAIPPYKEQEKIVEKFEAVCTIIDLLDAYTEDYNQAIKSIKSKILDLAIRGKLVPQDPNDEPASVLLERIRAEKEELIRQGKIKRDKKESVIFKGEDNSYYEKFDNGEVKCIDEDVPFELPASWCWCRLGTIFAHNTGKALNSSDTAGTLMTYITTANLYWDRFELDSLKEMPFTESEIEKCTVKTGDLLVCEGGDIGRSAIWMFDNDIRIQNHIHRLRPYVSLSNRFYYYVLYMWKQIGLIGGQGIGLQGFSSKALHNLIVPLPPLSEQMQIVSFVDELNQILSDIEKSLN